MIETPSIKRTESISQLLNQQEALQRIGVPQKNYDMLMNYHDHFFELPLVLSLKTPTKTDIQVVIVANTSTWLTR